MGRVWRWHFADAPLSKKLFVWLFVAVCILGGAAAGFIVRPHGAPAPALSRATGFRPRPHPKSFPFVFPGARRTLGGNYRFVALYGTPGEPALGALGEQNLDDSLARVRRDAQDYQPLSPQMVYPTFEI